MHPIRRLRRAPPTLSACAACALGLVAALACEPASAPKRPGQGRPAGAIEAWAQLTAEAGGPALTVEHRPFADCVDDGSPGYTRADPGPDWAHQPRGVPTDRAGWGLAVDDFDGDGHLDVFLPGYGASQLFQGDGHGGLSAAHERLPPLNEHGMAAAAADLDSDGDPDLIISNSGAPNTVLINVDGWFSRPTGPSETWGAPPANLETQSQTIGDIDGDSVLDVIFATFYAYELVSDPELHPNTAHLGAGDGTFLPSPHGLPSDAVYTPANSVGLIDFDEDGALDLFVINDKPPEYTAQVYRGDGHGRFEALPPEVGLRAPIHGMGLAEGDLNGDGAVDYAITGWAELAVLLSDGRGGWAESSRALGVVPRGDAPVGWGLEFEDIDLDGDLDIIIANGPEYDQFGRIGRGAALNPPVQPWAVYVQGEDGRFTEQAEALGLAEPGRRRGFVLADLNEDGQPEIIARELAWGAAEVWSPPCAAGAALEVRLEDVGGNRRAIGARLELEVDGRVHKRAIRAGTTSLASSGPPVARFGLGARPGAGTLTVRWPDGAVSTLPDVPTDGVLTLRRAP